MFWFPGFTLPPKPCAAGELRQQTDRGKQGHAPSAMRAERVTDKESSLPPLDTRNFFGSMLKAKTLQPENPRQSYCKGGTAKE